MENIHRAPNVGDRAFAEEQLQRYIHRGKDRAENVVQRVMSEVPTDRVVRATAVRFGAYRDNHSLSVDLGDGAQYAVHPHALEQAAAKVKMSRDYLNSLTGSDWGQGLAAHNLNTLMRNRFPEGTKRYLTREHNGVVRGWLSDSYKRMDSRPVLDGFIGAVTQCNARIVDGLSNDVRMGLTAVLPKMIEPVPGDFTIFGLHWGNSDYGKGAQELSSFVLRLVCLNGLVVSVEMRKIHLGARLSDDITYSDRTYELDSMAIASAVHDTTKYLLSEGRVDEVGEMLKAAHAEHVTPREAVAALRKDLTKGEANKVVEAFNSPDVVQLPPGQTTYRLSNAISWLANQTEDDLRQHELRTVAGKLVKDAAEAVAA